jgi:hypothetical protein
LKDQSSRDVYSWKNSGATPGRETFKDGNNDLYGLVNPSPGEDIDGDTRVDNRDAKTIINFTLDPKYPGDGRYKGKRDIEDDGRPWKLGDIYHSTPVVVGAPAFQFTDNNYQTFYDNNKTRQKMVYVGANDGMLHAFNGTDTSDFLKEEFAVIPKNLLGNLKNLRNTHDVYVDSSPKAYDVYVSGSWKTILISGQRGGGPYYFALDITKPGNASYPKILWEWTETYMGDAWAKPDIGKVKVGASSLFVAFITGGWAADSKDDVGNCFYIVDIETGATLQKFDKSNLKQIGGNKNRIPSGPTAFDADGDGLVDYVYFGDINGTLWRADVRSNDKADWAVNPLFIPGGGNPGQPKPIYYSPAVTKNDQGKILVFFGTGDEKNLRFNDTNYFWEIEDQNGTGVVNPGWPITLANQKVLSSPMVGNYVVYFTTWKYDTGVSCGPGTGLLWGLTVTKSGAPGGEAGLVLLDTPGPPPVWKPAVKFIDLGTGIPSAPVVTNGKIYLSSSVDANKIKEFTIPGWGRTIVRSWRELTTP